MGFLKLVLKVSRVRMEAQIHNNSNNWREIKVDAQPGPWEPGVLQGRIQDFHLGVGRKRLCACTAFAHTSRASSPKSLTARVQSRKLFFFLYREFSVPSPATRALFLNEKLPQAFMQIGWMEDDFRNLTAKVWANLDNPIKRYDFSKVSLILCMSPSQVALF